MKCLRALLIAAALIPPALAGCTGSKSTAPGQSPATGNAASPNAPAVPSYKIVSRRTAGKSNILEVRVSPGTSNGMLAQWSAEIVKSNNGKKNLQINFYDGQPEKNTLIARYENGRLFDPLRPGRILGPKAYRLPPQVPKHVATPNR